MRPELFTIPYLNFSIKSYGTMMVIGFLCALALARWLSRRLNENPDHVSNFGAWALLSGVLGARLFHVLHNLDHYREYPLEAFAVWSGGLEFLGGFFGAMLVMVIYFKRQKLSIIRYLDILAPALMLGLAFGRIGCFLNGCCFGAPCELPWAIRFPTVHEHVTSTTGCEKSTVPQYSIPFDYQITPDLDRRDGPLVELPRNYYRFDVYSNGKGVVIDTLEDLPPEERDHFFPVPRSPAALSESQLQKLKDGTYQMTPIHPAQIYSSLNAFLLSGFLTLMFVRWRRFEGQIFAVMLIWYGIARFLLEAVRNSSPYESWDLYFLQINWGLTISQVLSVIILPIGVVWLVVGLLWTREKVSKPEG